MLDRGGDDVSCARARQRTPHRGVDRLGAARGEHDLARARAEQRRDLLARVLDRDARGAPFGVQAAGVGVVVAQEREHRLERRRAQRRRRRVVEVGARHRARQTRATQWSPPSGRLVSNCGEVSP